MLAVQTLVEDKDTYLTRPDLGRVLSEASLQTVRERYKPVPQVLIVLSDGLSTDAVLANADEIVPPLTNGLRQAGFTVGDPLFLRYGRVKAEDRLGEAIGCDVVLMLVGERPGLGQSESMRLLRGCTAPRRRRWSRIVRSFPTSTAKARRLWRPPRLSLILYAG